MTSKRVPLTEGPPHAVKGHFMLQIPKVLACHQKVSDASKRSQRIEILLMLPDVPIMLPKGPFMPPKELRHATNSHKQQ